MKPSEVEYPTTESLEFVFTSKALRRILDTSEMLIREGSGDDVYSFLESINNRVLSYELEPVVATANSTELTIAQCRDLSAFIDYHNNHLWPTLGPIVQPSYEIIYPKGNLLAPLLETLDQEEQDRLRRRAETYAAKQIVKLLTENMLDKAISLNRTYLAWGIVLPENTALHQHRITFRTEKYIQEKLDDEEFAVIGNLTLRSDFDRFGDLFGNIGLKLLNEYTFPGIENSLKSYIQRNSNKDYRNLLQNYLTNRLISLESFREMLEDNEKSHVDRLTIGILDGLALALANHATEYKLLQWLTYFSRFIKEEPRAIYSKHLPKKVHTHLITSNSIRISKELGTGDLFKQMSTELTPYEIFSAKKIIQTYKEALYDQLRREHRYDDIETLDKVIKHWNLLG